MSYNNHRTKQYQALTSEVVHLDIRQHPDQAVVTLLNKEKTRKPVDPPPIIQLKVDSQHDGGSNYLVNPFLFMTAVLVDPNAQTPVCPNQLIGSFVSSLHRLKDIDNKDGGFFVFGDISCRQEGWYRLQFNLFEIRSEGTQNVTSAVSNAFRVMPVKEFRGLRESTHLSRTFSDQGVRLRLRKEARSLAGSKRSWDSSPVNSTSPSYPTSYGAQPDTRDYAYPMPTLKRQRSDSDPHSQVYTPGQGFGGPVSSIIPVTQHGVPGLQSYALQTQYPEQSASHSGMIAPTHTPNPTIMPYQRSYVPTYGAFNVADSPSTWQTTSRSTGEYYLDQRGHRNSVRPPNDSYVTNQGLQTPTSGSDGEIGAHSSQNLLHYGTEQPSHETASVGYSLGPPIQTGHGQQSTVYSMPGTSLNPQLHSYQALPDAGSLQFPQTTRVKDEYDRYPSMTNQQLLPSRDSYAIGPSSVSGTTSSSSLNAGLINSGFGHSRVPQQHPTLGSGLDSGISAYKSDSQGYPTPNVPSPME